MDFNSIDELYKFLETNVNNPKRQWDLTKDFKRFSDITTDELIKHKIGWECCIFDFYLENGTAKPVHSTTTEDGVTIWSYPCFENFNDDAYSYLKDRAKKVKNDFLIARYNQILWNSPTKHKHQQQAKNAVDAYLRILENKDCYNGDRHSLNDCIEIFKNGFSLCLMVKYKVNEFKQLFHSYLFEKTKFQDHYKIYLLQFLLELAQIKKDDFIDTKELLLKISKKFRIDKKDFFFLKTIFETGLKIAQKSNEDTKIWNKRIGDACCKMAESRMDDETKMIPLNLYKDAISYYKLAGAVKKIKDTEDKYFEVKRHLKLATVRFPLEDEHAEIMHKLIEAHVKDLLTRSPNEIFVYLTHGTDIFPNIKVLNEIAKKEKDSFADIATMISFDINKNISTGKESKKGKIKAKVYETYSFHLNLFIVPLLHRLFYDGILQNKITFETLSLYFLNETWLGQETSDTDSGGNLIRYKWISLIAPSLHEYFSQAESTIKSNNPFSNFILSIDSLTLKFEGVLRDFARHSNVSTTIMGKKGVLREKYIEDLLADETIKKYFDENDLLFFNFLFVAKDGLNLRNNVAHSFYRFNNYSFPLFLLLICAFLRIGKYKLTFKKEE